ncbi:MAG: hypothetical protein MOB07_29595 [Acidobacteria bacterium]|nr:hypothetical protein [Acidobacteriota bacterium]
MKAPRQVLQLTFLVIVICGVSQESIACSCITPPACEAFNRTKAVFIGRAIQASQKREDAYEGKTYISYFGEAEDHRQFKRPQDSLIETVVMKSPCEAMIVVSAASLFSAWKPKRRSARDKSKWMQYE